MTHQGKKYDSIATDFANMRDSFATERKYLDLLIQHLKPNSHILDVGCGSGYPIASYLIENGFSVTGIDASEELLKIANIKCPFMKTKLGDIRTIDIMTQYDAIIEWWCLFHIPKEDHGNMIARFASWLKKDGLLEFTTGDHEYEGSDCNMLGQELSFYSLDPEVYESYLTQNNFEIIMRESDQEAHLVWLAKYKGNNRDNQK